MAQNRRILLYICSVLVLLTSIVAVCPKIYIPIGENGLLRSIILLDLTLVEKYLWNRTVQGDHLISPCPIQKKFDNFTSSGSYTASNGLISF